MRTREQDGPLVPLTSHRASEPGHADQIASDLMEALRPLASPERAVQERRYLKSKRTHLGVAVPEVRRAVRALLRVHPELDREALRPLVLRLWESDIHELCAAAVELLIARRDTLRREDLDLAESLLRRAGTWALVDPLASNVVGALLLRHPDLEATIDGWAQDPDFWLRRSALLTALPALRRTGPAFEATWPRFARYADALLDEREFFVRKAIGWVLREAGARDPDRVAAWLAPRTHRASGVTMREAVKHLPPDRAASLLEAYREHRPLV